MMVDAAMVEEVKGLMKEGYPADKIKANLTKIGFSNTDAEDIMKEAFAIEARPVAAPKKPAPDVAPPVEAAAPTPPKSPAAPPAVAKPPAPPTPAVDEIMSEEDLLLSGGTELASGPASLPATKGPPAPPGPPKPPEKGHSRHHRRHSKDEAEAPEPMAEDEKPKSGAGKAIMIFIFAFIIIAVMAYFILLPKLGI